MFEKGILGKLFPELFLPVKDLDDDMKNKWGSGLFGCMDKSSNKLFDLGFLGFGCLCPCALYARNRLEMIKKAPGERLYALNDNCLNCKDNKVHAAALGLWYCLAPPCMGASTRRRIRESLDQHGTTCNDCLYHTLCAPCALAQEARQIDECYTGAKDVEIPSWRLSLKMCLPLNSQNKRIFDAVQAGEPSKIRDVFKTGGNVNVTDENQTSPLILAAQKGQLEVCKTLLELGANVHHTDRIGQSAIHKAAMYGHTQLLTKLWEEGGACDIQDTFGKSPLDYSSGATKKEIRSILGIKDAQVKTVDDLLKASPGVRIKK